MVLRDTAAKLTLLGRRSAYSGPVFEVRVDTLTLDGQASFERDIVHHLGAVAVVALGEDGKIVLVNQYRHAVGQRLWELPAGLLDFPGESPLAAAKRELAEEAEMVAEHWFELCDYYSSPGFTDEKIKIFLATSLSPVGPDFIFEKEAEEKEMIVERHDLADVQTAIRQGHVRNAALVVGVLATCQEQLTGFINLVEVKE